MFTQPTTNCFRGSRLSWRTRYERKAQGGSNQNLILLVKVLILVGILELIYRLILGYRMNPPYPEHHT